MSVVAARRMHWTAKDYLAFETASPLKHEFLDGEVFAMAGAQPTHNRLASNTQVALGALIRGRGCGTFNSRQRIYTPTAAWCAASGKSTRAACVSSIPFCLRGALAFHARLRQRRQAAALPAHPLPAAPAADRPARPPGAALPEGGWESRDFAAGRLTFAEWDGAIDLNDIYLLEE